MVDITIYSKNGVEKAVVKTLEYSGTFMGDRYVTVSVSSPTVINWEIGDYLTYRGETWKLWLLPATSKVSGVRTYGGAIEYKDIRFSPNEEELRRCSFLDVVLEDNEIHYTALPNFSFYCATPKDLADRIQANLDRLYPNQWTVSANPAASITDQSLSFSNNSCWEALAVSNTSLGLNFVIDSAQREIVIGGETTIIETEMEYGKGNGLKSIERTIDENQQVVNRLYAYGNTRNLPYRYYNKRYSSGSSVYDMVQSMYLPNLMLPGICKGWTASDAVNYLDENGEIRSCYGSDGQRLSFNPSSHWYENPDGSAYVGTLYWLYKHYSLSEDETMYYCDRVWIESEDSVNKCGVQEGVKFFDGSDELVDDIYPSLTGFASTAALAEAFGTAKTIEQNLTYEQGALDEILGADVDSWDGIIPEEQETSPTFHIRIKNIGFDLSDVELDASGDTPRLSMKSGMCAGREFNILECKKQVYANNTWSDYDPENPVVGPWSYYLKCEVAADDSIGQYFPNDSFALVAGDKFVILGIKMPDAYVDVAEMRLLRAAIVWLSENDKTSYSYTPAINNIFMQENPETSSLMKEGNILHIYDADLGIDVEMTISQIRIKNDRQIPEFEVTLSNDKEADLVQRVTTQVKQAYDQYLIGKGGGIGIYLIGASDAFSPSDNNAFSSRRSLRMFLRKDANDAASGKITFEGGTDNKYEALFTDERGFATGWSGWGARIGSDGKAEFDSISVRGALRAAELTFNLISAEEGESIRSIGHGEILTVTEDDNRYGTATLKLDGDQWASIEQGDLCRGLYNTVDKGFDNSNESGFDVNGFRRHKGFFASYFKVIGITANNKGECEFEYELQQGSEHPCPMMRFAVYGNTDNTKKERQSSIYTTAVGIAPRQLFLAGVNTWDIKPNNIKLAKGNIDGLVVIEELLSAQEYEDSTDSNKFTSNINGVVHYYQHKTLEGDAGFFCEDNIYLGGIINQFKAAALDSITSELGVLGQTWILSNVDTFVVDCDENGNALSNQSLELWGELMYGDDTLTLDTQGLCGFNDGNIFRGATFSNNDTRASRTFSFDQGDAVSTRTITIVLNSVSTNGTVYSARKSVSIIANRQGETGTKGDAGAMVIFLGAWNTSLTPVWNANIRNCVKHNSMYWLVNVPSDGTIDLGEPSSNNSNWLNLGALRFVATDLLLAERASISNLIASDVQTADIGTPHVRMVGDSVEFYGTGTEPSIKLCTDEDGVGVLRFFDKNGVPMYDLGPNGVLEVFSEVQNSWAERYMRQLQTSEGTQHLGSLMQSECTLYNKFNEGYKKLAGANITYNVSNASTPSAYNGRWYTSKDYTGTAIGDGWYASANGGNHIVDVSGIDQYDWVCETIYEMSSGKISRSVNVWFKMDDWSANNYNFVYDAPNGTRYNTLNELIQNTI